jgi:hypothetical protein
VEGAHIGHDVELLEALARQQAADKSSALATVLAQGDEVDPELRGIALSLSFNPLVMA